ncbi:hypothetical protein F511_38425 [Dorcoceras hygrometricum]|uniref:Uncharacterized protein n=1 Tax=Dorcoceras hygrometricum TaxID=472368 RepID=A0A2Z7CWX2_9LAMI|nr:hypothetical protein F511_38425 [Dorcoceras hygrometricum]
MLNIMSSVSVRESRIQCLCGPQWFRDTASRGSTTIVAPESQSRTCPSDHDSIGYPRMYASGESSTTMHRLLHASGSHPIPPPYDPNASRPSLLSKRRRRRPPCAAAARCRRKFVSGQLDEENPFVLISSVLLVQPDEGVSVLVVDRIGDYLPQSTEKSRVPVIPVGARHKCQQGNRFERPMNDN